MKNHLPRCPKNTFPKVFHLELTFLHLISNGLSQSLIDGDFIINFCVIYLVKTHNHLISSNAT